MKKSMFVAGAVLAVAAFTWGAEPVKFTDPNLKTIVEKTLGVAEPTPEDMLRLTRLYAGAHDIADLGGLEHAASLTSLCLHRNKISDIAPIAKLNKLTYLCLHDNAVEDISPIKELTGLVNLLLYGNKIADLSPVAHLTELTSLYVNNNRLTDIAAAAGLTKLRFLDVSNNELIDVSPAAGLSELADLRLNGNRITDLSPLEALDRLKAVWVFDNTASIPAKWKDAQIAIWLDAAQYAGSALDAPRGKLACKGEIGSFIVKRGNCYIRTSADADGVDLPEGEYRMANWEIEKKDSDGALWKLTAVLRAENKGVFTIAEGQTQTLEIGEPIIGSVTANKGRSAYSFGQTLAGRMGETITIMREGARPAPPKLHIRNKDGDYEQTFNFEYG